MKKAQFIHAPLAARIRAGLRDVAGEAHSAVHNAAGGYAGGARVNASRSDVLVSGGHGFYLF